MIALEAVIRLGWSFDRRRETGDWLWVANKGRDYVSGVTIAKVVEAINPTPGTGLQSTYEYNAAAKEADNASE